MSVVVVFCMCVSGVILLCVFVINNMGVGVLLYCLYDFGCSNVVVTAAYDFSRSRLVMRVVMFNVIVLLLENLNKCM